MNISSYQDSCGLTHESGMAKFLSFIPKYTELRTISYPICQRAVGREDPSIRTLQTSQRSRLNIQLVPGVTNDIVQSCSPCPPSLPVGETNYPAALVLHLHSVQAQIAWIKMLLHPLVWNTTINSSGYLIQQVMRAHESFLRLVYTGLFSSGVKAKIQNICRLGLRT